MNIQLNANATKKMSKVADFIWQDREIRFDVPVNLLKPRAGEKVLETVEEVEDSKGNTGELGTLVVTTLRIMWYSSANKKINLSVGLDCVIHSEVKESESAVKGKQMALYLRTRFDKSRFEFIFSATVKNNPRMFQSVQAVVRSYTTTNLYRDLKIRASIIEDKQLKLLPNEKVFTKYQGVWNLSAEQGNLGCFVITDVRIVWYAQLSDSFNVSLPWVQVKCVKIRESKYGTALALETSDFSGNYVLGFRVEKLEEAFTEICQLFTAFAASPNFGVECSFENLEGPQNTQAITQIED
jgi:Bardet-Biedl syndrome 5 protein